MLIHETEHFIVLHKPCGVSVNDNRDEQGELQTGLISTLNKERGAKLHPVHRLDKGTSGLFLLAKTPEANRQLSHKFQSRDIEKHYMAIVQPRAGVTAKKKQGWIKGDMCKSRNGSWKLLHSQNPAAITYFRSMALGNRMRLCLVRPHTGKTHQIRVALKSLSLPILGDDRYGGEAADRLYLHSFALSFSFLGKDYYFNTWPDQGEAFLTLSKSHVSDHFGLNEC